MARQDDRVPRSQSGGLIVSTDEDFEDYRNGALISRGTHQATFAIDDVTISPETADQDTTENGEKAMGVIFRCVGAPCIQAVWDGQKSASAWTDIYLQEAAIAKPNSCRVPGAAERRRLQIAGRLPRRRQLMSLEECLAFSTLLACMRIDRPNADLLAVVSDVAERFGSFVIGLAAKQASTHVHSRGAGPFEPQEHDLQKFTERARRPRRSFAASLSKVGKLEWRPQLTFGPVSEHVANEARERRSRRRADRRQEWFFFPSGQAHLGDLLLRLGRPVLAVPAGASGLELNEALVCWKDSREARRAVADALPMLQASKRVDVVEIVEAEAVDEVASTSRRRRRLARAARRRMRPVRRKSRTGPEARQLAATARDLNADLIVAGAFGHSRLREWAFGGVTKDLLLHADCCVLASH